jgi:drug/metabolite transporter (DMT)-like permease
MNRHPEGQASLFAAGTLFAVTALFVKFASAHFPGLFVSASRFAIGALLCALAIAIRKPRFDSSMLTLIVIRGIVGSLSMIATYVAISLTGPGRATLLSNTYPVFVGIFGALFFGEKPTRTIVLSLILCTAGAVLVIQDHSGSSLAGDLSALAGSVLAGLAVNFVRRASLAGVDPFVLYLSPCLFGLGLFAAAPLPSADRFSLAGIGTLLVVGAGAFLAQALMARGYRTVPANKGSIVFYWETALTVLLGMMFAGERINGRFVAGLVLIAAGLLVNRQTKRSPA